MDGREEELKKLKEHVIGEKLSPKEKELKERYGVMEKIPEQKIEEESEKKEVELPVEPPEETIPDLLLRIERLGAKFEVFSDFRRTAEERMSQLAEEIGELRSTFLNMEKRFTELEANIEKTLEAVSGIKPEEIKKEFDKRDKEFLELTATVEKNRLLAETIRKQNNEIKNTLDRIKDLENILNISKKINEKLAKLDETKLYADRTAAKVEVIFSELNEKLEDLEAQKEKLKRLDELTVDIVKSLDEMSIRVSKFIQKTEAEKLIEEMVKKKVGKIGIPEIKQFEVKLRELDKRSMENMSNLSKVAEYMKKMKEVVQNMGSMISERLSVIEKVHKESELYFKFLQIINILYYTSDATKVVNYLNELRDIVSIMKEINIWNNEMSQTLAKIFHGLAQTWTSYGQKDLAEIYKKETYNYIIH